MIEAAIFVIVPLCLALAALSDLFTMTIPNRVSVIMMASFAVVAPLAGLALPEIGLHVAAALIVFAACFALFAFNVMGGGDAKLLTACALWFGLNESLLVFLVCVSFLGGVLTIFIVIVRSSENTLLATGIPLPRSLLGAKKIPYGIAIGAGGFMAYPSSPLMQAVFSHL